MNPIVTDKKVVKLSCHWRLNIQFWFGLFQANWCSRGRGSQWVGSTRNKNISRLHWNAYYQDWWGKVAVILLLFYSLSCSIEQARCSSPFTWYAIHVVQNHRAWEQEKHLEKTTKEIIILKDLSPLFVLSKCLSCSPVWRFCTTWMTNYKGPITELVWGCVRVTRTHPHQETDLHFGLCSSLTYANNLNLNLLTPLLYSILTNQFKYSWL